MTPDGALALLLADRARQGFETPVTNPAVLDRIVA